MKLKQIDIQHFGQFSAQKFDLDAGASSLFYGENEAGKSTIVAFIKQVLFGFHLKSQASAFFEDYQPLAHVSPMGGSLTFADEDHQWELTRLWAKGDKSKKGLLVVKDHEQVVPEALFFERIHQIDGDFYTSNFIFNQDLLRQVESLSQEDLLERIYYLGAANSTEFLTLRDGLTKEGGQRFKKSGKKPPVNQALILVADKRADLLANQTQFATYRQEETIHRQHEAKLQEITTKLTVVEQQQTEITRLSSKMVTYESYVELKKTQQQLSFDPAAYQRVQTLNAEYKSLQAKLSELKTVLKAPSMTLDETAAESLLQQKVALLQWQAQLASNQRQRQEANAAQAELRALNPELTQLLGADQAKLQQLRQDYETTLAPAETTAKTAITGWLLAAGLGLGGLVLGMLLQPVWFGLVVFGLAIAGWQWSRQRHQLRAQELSQKKWKQQQATFTQKYGFKAGQVDLKQLFDKLATDRQYELTKKRLRLEQEELQENLSKLAANLAVVTHHQLAINFSAVLTALNHLEHYLTTYRQENAQQARYHEEQAITQSQLQKVQQQLMTILAAAGVSDFAAYQERYVAYLHQTEIATKLAALASSLAADLKRLAQTTLSELQTKQMALTAQAEVLRKQQRQVQQKLAESQVKLASLADSKAVLHAKQALANAESHFRSESIAYLAPLLAGNWLSRFLDIASNERFPKMLKAAKQYFQIVTGHKYLDILIDSKLTVVGTDGTKLPVKYLSRGTAEQLYFALKLAFVDQITSDINLPILIDDSFVNFDMRRTQYIQELLASLSQHQVLIFTARPELRDQSTNPILLGAGA